MRIAIVGKKAAGKSFVANYLVKKKSFKRMRVDDGVVKFVRYMYGYRKHSRVVWETRINLYDAVYKVDPEVQIDYLLRRLAVTTDDVVVDDVRYLNELVKLRESGFVVVRVTAPENRRIRLAGLTNASAGTVKLNEYFGRNFEAYPVEYSVINEDREKTRRAIDKIVDKEREKMLTSLVDDSSESSLPEEVGIEEEISTLNTHVD